MSVEPHSAAAAIWSPAAATITAGESISSHNHCRRVQQQITHGAQPGTRLRWSHSEYYMHLLSTQQLGDTRIDLSKEHVNILVPRWLMMMARIPSLWPFFGLARCRVAMVGLTRPVQAPGHSAVSSFDL